MRSHPGFRAVVSPLVAITLTALPADLATAQSCPATPDNEASGDSHFNGNVCRDDLISKYWNDFDFDKTDWQGYGYEDVCNIDLPLARTFNAIWVLQNAAAAGRGGTLLYDGYDFVADNVDELDAVCDEDFIAHTQWGLADNYTQLSRHFFFSGDITPPERASTLVHEGRHAQWVGHDGDADCKRQRSCDSRWDYFGANTYQVIWLWWYIEEGQHSTPALKAAAREKANYVLSQGFVDVPNFRL